MTLIEGTMAGAVMNLPRRVSIRSGRGLGDSLYLQSIARHLVAIGYRPEVCTLFPDVFLPLSGKVDVVPFRRDRVDRVAHYITRKDVRGTDQFIDCCINAGVGERVEHRLDWEVINVDLVRSLPVGLPIVVVQLPRAPMGREDGYGLELLPDCRTLQRAIDLLKGRAFIVQIGKGDPLFRFTGVDLDLANRTSVADMLDIASVAHGFLGYCSFIAPLAESLNKPALLVWSRKGLQSTNSFIGSIVPEKIFHLASSRHVVDDCSEDELRQAVDALYHSIRSQDNV